MRNIWFLLVTLLAGCASDPFASSSRLGTGASPAVLTVRERPAYPFAEGRDGVTQVDGRAVPGGPSRTVKLKPGSHVVTYSCPGWFSVDGYPELSYTFQPGSRYELDCGKEPHVEPVQ